MLLALRLWLPAHPSLPAMVPCALVCCNGTVAFVWVFGPAGERMLVRMRWSRTQPSALLEHAHVLYVGWHVVG